MKYTPARYTYVPAKYLDRFEVEPDTDTECPLEWGWEGEFFLLGCGYHGTLENYNSDSDVMRAFYELFGRHGLEKAQKIVKRRLGVEVHHRNLTGYSQGDWWSVAWIGDQPIDDLGSWLRGDVYGVTDTDTDESLWGIYADSEEDAVKYYIRDELNQPELLEES